MAHPRTRTPRPRLLMLGVLVLGLMGAGGKPGKPGKMGKLGRLGKQGRRAPARGMKDPTIPVSAIEALQEGKLARAWKLVDRHLQRQPRGRAGHAVLGGVESRLGWAPEALEAFEAGEGSLWYAGAGRALHANALRDVGRGEEARWLRMDDLRSDRQGVQLRAYANMIDDLRAEGDLIGADAVLAEALGRWPKSSLVLSAGADLALDRGDLAEAEGWLALIAHYGGAVRRTRHVNLRIALREGEHERVDEIALSLLRVQPGDPIAIAAMAHARVDRGAPEEALAVLGEAEAQRRGNATLLVAEARALAESGRRNDAMDLLAFVQARHPGDRDAALLAAHLGAPN